MKHMEKEVLYGYVDHTALKAFTTWNEIEKLCKEAVAHKMASVCIPSCYIARAHEAFPKLTICTVVGFPLGNANTAAKVAETRQALSDGATEIDMVINISDVKNGDYDKVTSEIRSLKEVCGDNILKVIIETCYLTEQEKIAMCKSVTDAQADFIETSTGFGTGGATLDDIKLMKANVGNLIKIKAAGGVRTQEDMEAFIEAGADRIGTSGAIAMLG